MVNLYETDCTVFCNLKYADYDIFSLIKQFSCQKNFFLPESLSFLFAISARNSIISIHYFCQKIYHFYSLFLPETPSFLFTISARKSIISIHYHFYSLFLLESLSLLFTISARKSITSIHYFCQKRYHFYSLFLPETL